MMSLEVKNHTMILTGRHPIKVKMINMNVLQVKKYYTQIQEE